MQFINFGARGSYAVPGYDTVRYGGNTTCWMFSGVSPRTGKTIVGILDAGTGIIDAGNRILSDLFSGNNSIVRNIFLGFTHFHPDHTQGFPFFGPNFIDFTKPDGENVKYTLNLMGVKTLKMHVGRVLEQNMIPPTYPIEYKDLKSDRVHHVLEDGDVFYINDDGNPSKEKSDTAVFEIKVMSAYARCHPQQGAMYYRVTEISTGKSVACIWDCESIIGGDQRVIAFAKGCDCMIHDSQYTTEEYNSSKIIVQGYGHSTYEMAIENARLAGCKGVIFTHYNPKHSDIFLDVLCEKYNTEIRDIRCMFAVEKCNYDI